MGFVSIILQLQSAFESELMGAIHAIKITMQKRWRALWIETDFLLIMKSYYDSSLVPWKLSNRWLNILESIKSKRFGFSHISR